MQSWTIVSAVAVFATGWLPTLPSAALLLVTACALALLALWRRSSICMLLAATAIGCCYGSYWGQSLLQARLPEALEGQLLRVNATLLEPPQLRRFSGGGQRQRVAAELQLLQCPPADETCELQLGKVLLSYYGSSRLRAGERWCFTVRLKRPRGLSNPASYNYEAWLAQHQFSATGYVRDQELVRLSPQPSLSLALQRWRQAIREGLEQGIANEQQRSVLLALSNGDRSGIDARLWQRFQRYGLNHLVVISGLHVGLVAGLGFLLGRPLGRRTAHLCAALAAVLYSALAGFALPTLRALVMLGSVQLVAINGRKIRPLRSLGLALWCIAMLDPLATHSSGFWLSFLAVGLIFYLRAMQPQLTVRQLTLTLQLVLSVSMGVLASYWFGGLGWLAPLANLLAVPILSLWLAPLCLLAALLLPLSQGLAVMLWQAAAIPITGFLWLDHKLQLADWALWWHFRPSLLQLFLLGSAVLLLLASRQLPGRWLAPALVCLALLLRPVERSASSLELWALDVGQGLALVLQTREAVVVYDTGAGDPAGPNMATAVLTPFLEQRGVDSIDLLVISHRDRDHASGVYSLHQRFEVAQTWVGDAPFAGLPGQVQCRAGQQLALDGLDIGVLWPQAGPPAKRSNNRSCVLRIKLGDFQLLLPGDIDADTERVLVRAQRSGLAAQLLVLAHHGSRSSSSAAFLGAVQPGLAIVSRGYANRFGHPHPEVLASLARRGIVVCDTAQHGALRLTVNNGIVEQVSGWRHKHSYYWSGSASTACGAAYNGALETH